MKRLVLSLTLLAVCAGSASAQTFSNTARWQWEPLYIRTTSAASVSATANWAGGSPGVPPTGFADSIVVRRVASNTAVDTSAAYAFSDFAYPPTYGQRSPIDFRTKTNADPSQHGPAGSDTLVTINPDTTDTTPWLAVRVRQDSTSHSWAGGSCDDLDSVFVGMQVSMDGIVWDAVSGTPTRIHDITKAARTASIALPMLAAWESWAGQDVVVLDHFATQLGVRVDTGTIGIANRNAQISGYRYFRLIINLTAAVGQYALDMGSWHAPRAQWD